MIFLADEGLDAPLVALLREEGYHLIYAAEEMRGSTDEEILRRADTEKAILLTKDKDFGELVIRRQIPSVGVVLIRIEKLNDIQNCRKVLVAITSYASQLPYSFTVIEDDKIRIRKL